MTAHPGLTNKLIKTEKLKLTVNYLSFSTFLTKNNNKGDMDHMSVFDDSNAAIDQSASKTPTIEELQARLADKDRFIEQLKGETAGLREDLSQRVGAEDLFRKIVENKPEPATPVVNASKESDKPVEEPNLDVDLAQKIRDEIANADRERVAASNAESVAKRLVEIYGSEEKAREVVNAKAAELGVSTKWLLDIAVQSPKAFFNTTGLESRSSDALAPRGDINLAALKPTDTGSNTPGTKAYFDAIRRDDPAKYWDPKVQNAIFKAAQEGIYKT